MRFPKIDSFANLLCVCDSPTNYERAFPGCRGCSRLWTNRLHETGLQSYCYTIKLTIIIPCKDKRTFMFFCDAFTQTHNECAGYGSECFTFCSCSGNHARDRSVADQLRFWHNFTYCMEKGISLEWSKNCRNSYSEDNFLMTLTPVSFIGVIKLPYFYNVPHWTRNLIR